MAHRNTVFGQLLTLLPRHEFDAEARGHQRGQRLRVMSRWAQFVALGLGQLASRQSLRDIVSNLRAQPAKLYHLGVGTVSRSSLARVNAEQPYTLYEALFGRLLSRCQQRAPGHGFRFRHKLYAVDASTIDLCLAVFPWASFRRTKAAIKLHVGLDQAGHLPSFVSVTDGKTGDVTVARTWTFEAGSVVVADRAYLDFAWFHQLQARGVTFVTRLKRGVRYRVTHEHEVRAGTGILSDQTIELTSARSRKVYPHRLRRVVYRDPLTTNRYVFVTNNTTWVAKTIADLYKSRWQIELFFKWIKQHLKVKRFVGRSKNAVLTQLWVATCMYLLLAYLKFVLRLCWSLNQMLQVLQLNVFERRPLEDLFTTHSPPDRARPQLALGLGDLRRTVGTGRRRQAKGIDPEHTKNATTSGSLGAGRTRLVVFDQRVVDFPGNEAFQAADDVFLRQALGGASSDVVEGRLVPAHADDHDPVERRVGLAVAAAEEPMPVRDPARGGNRAGAAQLRKRGFGTDPGGVVAGNDQHLGRRVGTNPERLTQGRRCRPGEDVEQLVVPVDLGRKCAPAGRERP